MVQLPLAPGAPICPENPIEHFVVTEMPHLRSVGRSALLSGRERAFVDSSAKNLVDFMQSTTIDAAGFDWTWTLTPEVAELIGDATLDGGLMTGLENALRVKRAIRTRLSHSITDAERLILFRWFVTEYGQVKNNKKLDSQIGRALELATPRCVGAAERVSLSGISTISKCLTLLDEKLPIYDSRVCYAMNAINFVRGTRDFYLQGPQGRNASLGLVDLRVQFLLADATRLSTAIEELEVGGQQRARRALTPFVTGSRRTYALWCRILSEASAKLKGSESSSIDELEIILFACAPTTCVLDLMKSLSRERPIESERF